MINSLKVEKDKNNLISKATYSDNAKTFSMHIEEKDSLLKVSFNESEKLFLSEEYIFQHCKEDPKKLDFLEIRTHITKDSTKSSKNRKIFLKNSDQQESKNTEKLPEEIEKKIQPFIEVLASWIKID